MKNNETINILFCGIGGQGVLKASELCCLAALFDGYHVKKSEVHGMAQRGGSVESHVRFGRLVYSPLIPCGMVDYLLPLHRDEHEQLKHFLKPGGIDLLQWLEKAETADKKYLNTYMVGVLSRFLPIRPRFLYPYKLAAYARPLGNELRQKRLCLPRKLLAYLYP